MAKTERERREYQKAYQAKNRERIKKQKRRYYLKNRERFKACNRIRYATLSKTQRSKRRTQSRAWYQNNRHRLLADPKYCRRRYLLHKRYWAKYAHRYRASNRLRAKRHYWAHPERHRKQSRAWYRANLAYVKEYRRKYGRKNAKRLRAAKKRYTRLNRDHIKLRGKKWYKKNRTRQLLRMREYGRRNRQEQKKYNHRRYRKKFWIYRALYALHRAKKAGAKVNTDGLLAFFKRIKAGKRVKCHYCGRLVAKGKRHIDHKTPFSRGGTHCLKNLAPSCAPCNLRKGKMTAAEFKTFRRAWLSLSTVERKALLKQKDRRRGFQRFALRSVKLPPMERKRMKILTCR
jgi:5-methylcytosine-specific restriction endonuclease McrA